MITVNELTLCYPNGKGVFDLSFQVKQGEVMGYLGPNGAGKTTTIRNLLGFTKPERGTCTIDGLDCFTKATQIQLNLGYMPGEITFLDAMRGDEFLKFMHQMRGTRNQLLQQQLCQRFELNVRGPIKRFSKGMKQKLGIVTAFMHDPSVLILDEPTSGLDPLMQNRFVELILEEKQKGKTILMSSHMFEEIERTCDNVLIIKEGKLVAKSDIVTLKKAQSKVFVVTAKNASCFQLLIDNGFAVESVSEATARVSVKTPQLAAFFNVLAGCELLDFDMHKQSLEEVFLHFYGQEVQGE